ncbi:putative ABC transporter permease [Clostridium akagii]|uniref:putative ABC transporter permease n=1 Tax=Clostridium akagii TaxID=91623 RepID=UPI00047B8724|nr:putative ABC transporter permease [Clostridium akagii]
MRYTGYELFAFFLIYSLLGWIAEVLIVSLQKGSFINRGMLNGPLCPIYGFSIVLSLQFLEAENANTLALIVGNAVLVTVVECIAGGVLRRITGRRLWNYDKPRFFIAFALAYSGASVLVISLLQPLVYTVSQMIPWLLLNIILWVLFGLLMVDVVASFVVAFHIRKESRIVLKITEGLSDTKKIMGQGFFAMIQRRVNKAFPELENVKLESSVIRVLDQKKFAEGICFEKLVWMFIISALAGDLIETGFVWATTGNLMSRSSLIYGPFSVVWGLGGVIATFMLHGLIHKNAIYIFLGGFLLGGTYEYSCSVFTEKVLGTRFWDYSSMPFNLDGRVNLLYCLFWGLLAIVWLKLLYPLVSKYISKIPWVSGEILTWCIVVFIVLNASVSAMALYYYGLRMAGTPRTGNMGLFFSFYYPNTVMKLIYPNAVLP